MSVNKGAGVGRLADREHVELEWLYRVREIVLLKYSYILEQRAGEAQRGRLHSKKTFVFFDGVDNYHFLTVILYGMKIS